MVKVNKTVIVTDSCSDLSKEIYKARGIYVVPFCVIFDGTLYYDGVDVDGAKIFEMVSQKNTLPTTASPSPKIYYDIIKPLYDEGCDIVFIGIGKNVSGGYTIINSLREEFTKRFYVIDSANLSSAIGLQILDACDLRDQGKSGQEIYDTLSKTALNVFSNFSVYQLDYLKKGGRVSSFKSFIGSILRVKPVLGMHDGLLKVRQTVLGNFTKAMNFQLNELEFHYKHNNLEQKYLIITHAHHDEGAQYIRDELKRRGIVFETIYDTYAGATISSHCGPKTLGIIYRVKDHSLEFLHHK